MLASPTWGRKREPPQLGASSDKENAPGAPSPSAGGGGAKRRATDSGVQLTAADGGSPSQEERGVAQVPSLPSEPCLVTAASAGSGVGPAPAAPRDAGNPPGGATDREPADPPPGAAAARPPPQQPRRFASRSFYGSRLQQAGGGTARQQQVEDRVLRFLANVQRRFQAAADAPSAAAATWQVFPSQQPAFDLADSQPGLEVFSGACRSAACCHLLAPTTCAGTCTPPPHPCPLVVAPLLPAGLPSHAHLQWSTARTASAASSPPAAPSFGGDTSTCCPSTATTTKSSARAPPATSTLVSGSPLVGMPRFPTLCWRCAAANPPHNTSVLLAALLWRRPGVSAGTQPGPGRRRGGGRAAGAGTGAAAWQLPTGHAGQLGTGAGQQH